MQLGKFAVSVADFSNNDLDLVIVKAENQIQAVWRSGFPEIYLSGVDTEWKSMDDVHDAFHEVCCLIMVQEVS